MDGGGAERVVSHILSNIDRNKFKLFLILFRKEGPYLSDIPADVKIISLKNWVYLIPNFEQLKMLTGTAGLRI